MDHESGGLIYDNQRLIFINDLDRNVLRRESGCHRSDQLHFDTIVFAEFVGRFGGLIVYEYIFTLDQPLQTRPAPALELRSKIGIESNSDMLRADFENIHSYPLPRSKSFMNDTSASQPARGNAL